MCVLTYLLGSADLGVLGCGRRERRYVSMGIMDAPQKKAPLLFHALSDPTRLELLKRLKGGEKCVCELTDVMQAGQSRLSFHLKVLKDAGLVRDRRDGRWKYYSMNQEGLNEVKGAVGELVGGTNMTTGVSHGYY